MKLTDKRFWILLIVMANVAIASSQTVFSVEKISKDDFEAAGNSKFAYAYNMFRDSITANEITIRIVQDARMRFEELDSITHLENYDIGFDREEYEGLFSVKSLIYLEPLEMYGFLLPTLHGCELYGYDMQSGNFLGKSLLPFAISEGGIMVAQTESDCDQSLDLHFYTRSETSLYEFMTYKSDELTLDYIADYYASLKYSNRQTSFWFGDNVLYISFQSPDANGSRRIVYLKITLSGSQKSYNSVKYMIEHMIPNEAIRTTPRQKVTNMKKGGNNETDR